MFEHTHSSAGTEPPPPRVSPTARRAWGSSAQLRAARDGHPRGGHGGAAVGTARALTPMGGLGVSASFSLRGAGDQRVSQRLYSLSIAKRKKKKKIKNLHFDSDSSSPILESVGLLQPTQGSSAKQNNSE